MSQPAISVRNLRKAYANDLAVRDISFDVFEGEVFGLLGPNGAGKTTTVEILEAYRMRDAGDVEVLGVDPAHAGRAWKEQIGIVLQENAVPRLLTVRELVTLFAGYYPKPRDVDEVIELVGLADKAHAPVKTLSGGQQRRIDLALGLIGDPRLLFLDEPTTGFDPSARRNAWDLISSLRRWGKTVLLTTHYMDEAQHLADRICVVAHGEVVAEGTPATLGGRQEKAARIRFELPDGISGEAVPVTGTVVDGTMTIETETPTQLLAHLTSWAIDRNLELPGLEVSRPTLEDVYLELTR